MRFIFVIAAFSGAIEGCLAQLQDCFFAFFHVDNGLTVFLCFFCVMARAVLVHSTLNLLVVKVIYRRLWWFFVTLVHLRIINSYSSDK